MNQPDIDQILADPERLVAADPDELLPALWHASTPSGRLAGEVYRASFYRHRTVTEADRRSLLAVDAARHGATELSRALANPPGHAPMAWQPRWATAVRTRHPALHVEDRNHGAEVWGVATTELDGRQVVLTADRADFVAVWDLNSTDTVGAAFDNQIARVRSLTCTTMRGRPVAVLAGLDGVVRVWDLATREVVGPPLLGHTDAVTHVACTEVDGQLVGAGVDCTVWVWKLEEDGFTPAHVLFGHTDIVWRVACTVVDGRAVALTASGDGTVRRWDLRTGGEIEAPLVGHASGVRDVACAELHGRPIAVTGDLDGVVLRWDLRTGEQIGDPSVGHEGGVFAIVCTEVNGRPVTVSGASDQTLRIWDLETGAPLGTPLTGHQHVVYALSLARRNGRLVVVSVGWDWRMRVWDLGTACDDVPLPPGERTGQPEAIITTTVGGRGVAVTGGYKLARAWDLATGEPVGAAARVASGHRHGRRLYRAGRCADRRHRRPRRAGPRVADGHRRAGREPAHRPRGSDYHGRGSHCGRPPDRDHRRLPGSRPDLGPGHR